MKQINRISFKEFIDKKNEYIRKIEQDRKNRIYAAKNNLPLPKLDFEVELWMLA
jgi:hypothetical protein